MENTRFVTAEQTHRCVSKEFAKHEQGDRAGEWDIWLNLQNTFDVRRGLMFVWTKMIGVRKEHL